MLIFELDNNRSVELSKLDTTKGLPCVNVYGPGLSPDPKPPHSRLSKFWFIKLSNEGNLLPKYLPGFLLVGDKKIVP